MIERWLAGLERQLRVHGRRRRRIVEELATHLHECAATHGEANAVERMGDPQDVARSFTPRLVDRVFEQRGRLAALTMLAAMAASLPLAADLRSVGQQDHSYAWLWFFVLLSPTAAVALVSCLAVLRRRDLGSRLAGPLVAMVLVTAFVVVFDLPPAGAEFREYQAATAATELGLGLGHCVGCATIGAGDIVRMCDQRSSCIATDHASEIRFNYSAGAVVLSLIYLWAVTGWTPRHRRSRHALA
jgi:hypothetical protein